MVVGTDPHPSSWFLNLTADNKTSVWYCTNNPNSFPNMHGSYEATGNYTLYSRMQHTVPSVTKTNNLYIMKRYTAKLLFHQSPTRYSDYTGTQWRLAGVFVCGSNRREASRSSTKSTQGGVWGGMCPPQKLKIFENLTPNWSHFMHTLTRI